MKDYKYAMDIILPSLDKQYKYDRYFLNRCFEAASMSYCKRLQVGAVAVRDNRTILDGWNGTISGQDNCCEETTKCKLCDGVGNYDTEMFGLTTCSNCKGTGLVTKTKESTIHAERNIIFYAAKKGIALEGATMYVSHAPCIGCAQAMAASGIIRVVYADDYKSDEGVKFLRLCRIQVDKISIKE